MIPCAPRPLPPWCACLMWPHVHEFAGRLLYRQGFKVCIFFEPQQHYGISQVGCTMFVFPAQFLSCKTLMQAGNCVCNHLTAISCNGSVFPHHIQISRFPCIAVSFHLTWYTYTAAAGRSTEAATMLDRDFFSLDTRRFYYYYSL